MSTAPSAPARPASSDVPQAEWFLAAALTIAAIALHLSFLSHAGGFWRDEVNTLNLSSRGSLSEMANDSFPVLMPCLVRAWGDVGMGGDDTRLRLLGVVIGLGTLVALWVAAWMGRRSPPLLSLVLVGLNATFIFYGDSLRAFGLGSLLVALTIAALCGFVRRPGWKQASWVGLAALLSVQALYQNAVLIAALWLGAWVVCWRRRDRPAAARLLAAVVPSVLSLLPYWSKVIPLMAASPESGVATLRTVFRPSLALGSLQAAAGFPFSGYVYVWGLALLVVVGLAAAEWRARLKVKVEHAGPESQAAGELRLLAAVALLTSVAGFGAFLWFARLRTEPWYFLPLLVLAGLCFDLGWPRFRRGVLAGWLVLLLASGALTVPVAQRALQCRFTNADLIAARLRTEAAPGDYVLVIPWNRGISFERYFRNWTTWDTVPPLTDHSTHRYDLVQRETQAQDVLRPVYERITSTLQAGHRVWVVGSIDVPTPGLSVPADLPPPPLKYTGWSAGPYVRNWTDQVTQFLSNHSRKFDSVPMSAPQPINHNEQLELFVAEGWQTGV